MKNKEEWKKKVFERVKSEIHKGMDWDSFSKQVDNIVYVYGGEGLKAGKLPPHGKNEIWLPALMEREILKMIKEAVTREGLVVEKSE